MAKADLRAHLQALARGEGPGATGVHRPSEEELEISSAIAEFVGSHFEREFEDGPAVRDAVRPPSLLLPILP